MVEETNKVYTKMKACKGIADTLFKEFNYANKIEYFELYNKRRVLWGLLREYASSDIKKVVERLMDGSDNL
jgi:hypothetical protein